LIKWAFHSNSETNLPLLQLKPMMHSLIVPYKDVKEEGRDILERIGQSQLAHPDSTVCVFLHFAD
jgi:hypothetical protein